jgi:4-diphosphocytidyl-2-C-methyl-D-erythritol kinase
MGLMRILQNGRGIVVAAPAKINLFLELLGKRPDGYHELATLMVAVSLCDALSFFDRPQGGIELTCDRPELSTATDNLIVKAAQLLQDHTGTFRGVTIRLRKRIPVAAGLAGGSTDAAATLVALDRLWNLNVPRGELANLAAKLGSDVGFFLSPLLGESPAAWCTGRGEIVEPVSAPRAIDVVLVFPPFGCDTASVYRHAAVGAKPESGDCAKTALAVGDTDGLAGATFNRLETAARMVAPRLEGLQAETAAAAPLGCRMSGSGSTLFAMTRNSDEARALVQTLTALPALAGCGIRAVRTLTSPHRVSERRL